MKKIVPLLILCITLILGGCSKKSSGNPTSPIGNLTGGGNGNGTGSVTYTVTVTQDQQQNSYFVFTPNTDATIDSLIANCPEAGISNATVPGDGTSVYNSNSPAELPITGNGVTLQSGQHWAFVIMGKKGSQTGQAYTANASYTVQ